MGSLCPISLTTRSADHTIKVGQSIGSHLKGGEVIELTGDLGSGKTTLIKGLVAGADSQELVSSPSFTICNEYISPKFKIYHFDFYRLSDPGIIKRELVEVINSPNNVIVIEWPEVIENILPNKRLIINMSLTKGGDRLIKLGYLNDLNYLIKDLL